MDVRTIKALEASIAKWERNAVAVTPDDYSMGAAGCPLCAMFAYADGTCVGCPVYARTGEAHCEETPYGDAVIAHDDWESGLDTAAEAERARKAARAEVEFLRSLLPAGRVATPTTKAPHAAS